MRLDFNVLWVDDQQAYIQNQRERIELLISKEGFRLQVQFASTVDEATKCLSNDIYGDHIDLILMDYDLGAGGKGDDGLERVRQVFPFKDIVFYSSQAPDLADMVAAKKVQGVFCSTRDDLPDTVDGVFEALVKKVLDIDHSRGIVMGATSDIDQYVNECLVGIFDSSNDEQRGKTIKVLDRHLKEKRKCFEKEEAAIKAIAHVSELFDHHAVYTSNDRLRLLRNALGFHDGYQDQIEAVKECLDTVPKRNILAHVRVVTDGFSRKLFDKDGNELTSDDMKDLRSKLLKHQDFFEEFSKALKS